MNSFEIGDVVNFQGYKCTILGFNKEGTQMLIEGYPSGHDGNNKTYHYDKEGNTIDIPKPSIKTRYFVGVDNVKLISSQNKKLNYEFD